MRLKQGRTPQNACQNEEGVDNQQRLSDKKRVSVNIQGLLLFVCGTLPFFDLIALVALKRKEKK